MALHILNKTEKQEILNALKIQFGINNLPGILIKIGGERIFLFQGSLNEKEIKNLEHTVPIERVGIYFAKMQGNQVRLSIDGCHLLKDQIKNNIFILNDKQMQEWMSGSEILLDEIDKKPQGFVIMKYKDDLLGTGKASEKKITNFIPKSRRLKTPH